MMKNTFLIIIALVIIVLGAWLIKDKVYLSQTSPIADQKKNVQMLENGNKTPIVIKSDMEYFPGAKGYFAQPEQKGTYPGVVMIHENKGLRPEIKTTAEQLAREGYMVLAVDLYKGNVAETQEEARALGPLFEQKTGTENMRAAAKFLRDQGATKLASLGWCFGGRQSIELAISGEKLDATVVYYGGGMASTTDKLAPITWPVLGIFGDKDQAIPVEKVKEFEASLNTLGVKNEIHIYPGVGHAFANPSGMNYAPEATKDAWAKTINFLATYLK
jgi:carboxymethylenebutenolidase